jgi:hypothetical protein
MDRVWHLSKKLRGDGVDCRIDQHEESPAEGWSQCIGTGLSRVQRMWLHSVEVSVTLAKQNSSGKSETFGAFPK